MKKEDLRRVEFSVYTENDIEKIKTYQGYFHEWGREQQPVYIPITDTMRGIKNEIVTVGIVEVENTGVMYTVDPSNIRFLS